MTDRDRWRGFGLGKARVACTWYDVKAYTCRAEFESDRSPDAMEPTGSVRLGVENVTCQSVRWGTCQRVTGETLSPFSTLMFCLSDVAACLCLSL